MALTKRPRQVNNSQGGKSICIKEEAVSKGFNQSGGIELVLLRGNGKIKALRLEPKTPDAKMRCAVLYQTIDDLLVPQWRLFMGLEKIAIGNARLDGGHYEWKLEVVEAIDLTMAFNIDIQKWEVGTNLGNAGHAEYDPRTSIFTLRAGKRSK